MLLAGILEDAGGWRLIPRGLQGVVERGLAKLPPALIRARPRLALAQVYLQIKLGELGAARVEYDRFLAECGVGDLSVDLRTEVRSEEHTSELQSLMRISYAVFCLKKKKTIRKKENNHTTSGIV